MKRIAPLLMGIVLAWASPGRGFHAGGVGRCEGCHAIHGASGSVSGGRLLAATDPSSICLNCHQGPGGPDRTAVLSYDGSAMTPGGDFYWLTKNFTWLGGASPGYGHGHNVVARDFGLPADGRQTTAPGGAYPASDLACTSCHDPHGGGRPSSAAGPVSGSGSDGTATDAGTARGNYRLLGGAGYDGGSQAGGVSFKNAAPTAAAAGYGESDELHVDYGSGMSLWCSNCHGKIHNGPAASFRHGFTASFSSTVVERYNTYVATGDLSGTAATAYLALVPFERGVIDATLLDPADTSGAGPASQVMCLTCHRAHASAFRSIGRWDFDAIRLADSHPALGDGGVAGNDVEYSYYGRDLQTEFGPEQGSLCEKCHSPL